MKERHGLITMEGNPLTLIGARAQSFRIKVESGRKNHVKEKISQSHYNHWNFISIYISSDGLCYFRCL
jgi:hypothetical protein